MSNEIKLPMPQEGDDVDFLIYAIAHLEHTNPDVFCEADAALTNIRRQIETLKQEANRAWGSIAA